MCIDSIVDKQPYRFVFFPDLCDGVSANWCQSQPELLDRRARFSRDSSRHPFG